MQQMRLLNIKNIFKASLIGKLEIVFSLLFTLILVLGRLLSTHESIDVVPPGTATAAGYIIGAAIIWLIVLLGISALKKILQQRPKHSKAVFLHKYSDKKLWALLSLTIFMCYFPIILLTISVLTPDSWSSIAQINGDSPLSNTHPLIFTIFAGLFIRTGLLFGSLEFGLLLYSIAQSVILAMIFAKVIVWMRQEKINNKIILITFLFYAVLPINSLAGVIMWKDVLFAAFGLMFLLFLRQLYVEKNDFFIKRNVLNFVFFAFLFCAWRNNGIYAYVLFAIIVTILNRQLFLRKKYLLLLTAPLALFVLYSGFVSLISKPTTQVEALSVPVQQIARTVKYHGNTIDAKDMHEIKEILPFDKLGELYNPNLSDPVKSSFNEIKFKENEIRYAKLWLRLAVTHKKTYIAAFLYNSYGYVYPFNNSPTPTDTVVDNASNYNSQLGYVDGAYNSGGKKVIIEYKNLMASTVPILHNVGFYFCGVLLALYVAILKKRFELVGVFILMFSVFLTTILGPVNGEFRYLYLFVLSTPFIITSAYYGDTVRERAKIKRGD